MYEKISEIKFHSLFIVKYDKIIKKLIRIFHYYSKMVLFKFPNLNNKYRNKINILVLLILLELIMAYISIPEKKSYFVF